MPLQLAALWHLRTPGYCAVDSATASLILEHRAAALGVDSMKDSGAPAQPPRARLQHGCLFWLNCARLARTCQADLMLQPTLIVVSRQCAISRTILSVMLAGLQARRARLQSILSPCVVCSELGAVCSLQSCPSGGGCRLKSSCVYLHEPQVVRFRFQPDLCWLP